MTSTRIQDEWIGVAEVASELSITPRQAWEMIRKLGVPCVGPARDVMRLARFTRADWEAARDGSKAPPTPRGGKQKAKAAAVRVRKPAVEPGEDLKSAWRRFR